MMCLSMKGGDPMSNRIEGNSQGLTGITVQGQPN